MEQDGLSSIAGRWVVGFAVYADCDGFRSVGFLRMRRVEPMKTFGSQDGTLLENFDATVLEYDQFAEHCINSVSVLGWRPLKAA